jgi:hypothetical protein
MSCSDVARYYVAVCSDVARYYVAVQIEEDELGWECRTRIGGGVLSEVHLMACLCRHRDGVDVQHQPIGSLGVREGG